MAHTRKRTTLSQEAKIIGIAGILLAAAFFISFVQAQTSDTASVHTSVEDRRNQEEQLKNQFETVKNLRRTLADTKRDLKNAVDTTKIDTLINQLEQCDQKLAGFVGTGDFWDGEVMRECVDIGRAIDDEFSENLNPKRICADRQRTLKDQKRERKELEGELKDILRNDKSADVSGLRDILKKMDDGFASVDQIPLATCDRDSADALDALESDINSLKQDFRSLASDIGGAAGQRRQTEDNRKSFDANFKKKCEREHAREIKDFEKEFARATKKGRITEEQTATRENVKVLYNTLCVDIIGQMSAAIEAGDDGEFQSLRQEFWNTESDLSTMRQEALSNLQETSGRVEETKNVMRDLQQKEGDLKRMKKQLVKMKKKYDRAVKKFAEKAERKELLAGMAEFVSKAESLTAAIETLIVDARTAAPEDPESYWSDYQDELNDLQNEFNELQSNVERIGGIFGELQRVEKELKKSEKEIGRYEDSPETQARLRELLQEGKQIYQQIWTDLVRDPEGAEQFLNDLRELVEDWSEVIQEYEEQQ